MRVLLIYKKSSFSQIGDIPRKVANTERFLMNHRRHHASLKTVEATLKKLGLLYHKKVRGPKADTSGFDLVITLGGDGTLLGAGRRMSSQQLLLGVNSDPEWSVGQFCRTDATGLEKVLKRILKGKHSIHRLHKLKIKLKGRENGSGRILKCLNDVLICHSNPAAMSRYEIHIGKRREEHRDSGLWVASAAGSTGAILSAGGRKLSEESRKMQYQPRELYHFKDACCRLTGGLVAEGGRIKIISHMPKGCLFLDGSHIKVPFGYGHEVVISSSPDHVRLVHV